MKKDRIELEELLDKFLKNLDKHEIEEVKNRIYQNHNITPGRVQQVINGDIDLLTVDEMLLCLLTNYIYKVTENTHIDPNYFFNKSEIKKSLQQKYSISSENSIEFPLVFDEVIALSEEDFLTKIDIKDIVELYNTNILTYNFETQRNPKYQIQARGNEKKIIEMPNLNRSSITDIEKHLESNTFLPSKITFNCLAGTAEESENEIMYDEKNRKLTIYKCQIDIVDGFHRIAAMLNAYEKNPDVEFVEELAIKNYSLDKARSFVKQINTVNKMDTSHLKSLDVTNYANFIVREVERKSDLNGKVSKSSRPIRRANQIVSFITLSDAVEENFNIKNKKEAIDVAEYLTEFFDYLIGSYPEAFMGNIQKVKKESMINENVMFAGYIILAKKIKEENYSLSVINSILENINFSKDNSKWQKLGVVDSKKNISNTAKNRIKKFFKELNLKEVLKNEQQKEKV